MAKLVNSWRTVSCISECEALSNLCTETGFDLFLAAVMSKADSREIKERRLSRRRAALQFKLDCGTAVPEYFQTPKHLYRAVYHEALDLVVTVIKDRFDQRDYNKCMNWEQLLLKTAGEDAYKDDFQTATGFCGCDFDSRELDAHLSTFTHNIPRVENVTFSNKLTY